MNLSGNTILITGGASGIGFALAKRFARFGSQVVICGRRTEQLNLARQICPELHTVVADISHEEGREQLLQRISQGFPKLNVLINNAGIQNRPPAIQQPQDWSRSKLEIATNLEAPIHLSMLFVPHLP